MSFGSFLERSGGFSGICESESGTAAGIVFRVQCDYELKGRKRAHCARVVISAYLSRLARELHSSRLAGLAG